MEMTSIDKKYQVLYVEAPWEDKEWPMERIRSLPVEKWVRENALLLMWIPANMLPHGLLLLGTWSFEYAGLIVWRKPKDYLEGYWWRSHCEYILVGKRGTAKTDLLLSHTLYEGAYSNSEFKPQAFRALLSSAGYFAFGGEFTSRLDLFGAYWQHRYPRYDKEYWDFLSVK